MADFCLRMVSECLVLTSYPSTLGFLVDFVLFWRRTERAKRGPNSGFLNGAISLQWACVLTESGWERSQWACRTGLGFLAFLSGAEWCFWRLPLNCCRVAWDEKQRFLSRGNVSSLWCVTPEMACQPVSEGLFLFFVFPECLLITKNQVFQVSVQSISERKWLIYQEAIECGNWPHGFEGKFGFKSQLCSFTVWAGTEHHIPVSSAVTRGDLFLTITFK